MKVRVFVLKYFLVEMVCSPPRLEHGETTTAALVATVLVTYDSCKTTARREAGNKYFK